MEGLNLDVGEFSGTVPGAQASILLRRVPFCGVGWVLGGWNLGGRFPAQFLTKGQLYGLVF